MSLLRRLGFEFWLAFHRFEMTIAANMLNVSERIVLHTLFLLIACFCLKGLWRLASWAVAAAADAALSAFGFTA